MTFVRPVAAVDCSGLQGGSSPRLLVSLATYNEAGNIAALIHEIHHYAPQADILVIDDNSPDGTAALVQQLAVHDRRIHLVRRPGKLGLGTAILTAMRYAMERQYDLLLNLDADFSHPPRYIPGLLAGMSRYDVMIGSRYVRGGGTQNWPWLRRCISRGVNWLVRFLLRTPARDASGAFRCYRVRLLQQVPLDQIRSRGYSFQQEVLFRCHKAGARIGEYPILFENRRAGASKVNPWEALRSISMILYLGARNWLGWEKRIGALRPPADMDADRDSRLRSTECGSSETPRPRYGAPAVVAKSGVSAAERVSVSDGATV
ncbi:MAG: polyprenol monophosphomannose synthase [Gemmataceae bacterium]|nr:polyprenol monophosphomannose synthase [Gemmataceae bacterium]MDW8242622.1 polyprenol monophosphomannose synthase [Thermogemmata sp.]